MSGTKGGFDLVSGRNVVNNGDGLVVGGGSAGDGKGAAY